MNGLPSSIQVPGNVSGPGAGGLAGLLGGGAPAPSGAEGPEPANDTAENLVKKAQALIAQAITKEPEPEDKLELHQIAADMQKYIAGEQKLKDTAMGAGPGAKMIRKASTSSSGGY